VELGTLQRMLQDAGKQRVSSFMKEAFSRVTPAVTAEIIARARIKDTEAQKLGRPESELLYKSIQEQKLMGPPTSCLSPIGEEALIKGLYALYGDKNNLQDDDDLEHLAPEKVAANAGAKEALLAQMAAEAEPAAPEKLPGKRKKNGAAPQLSLFQRASTTPPVEAAPVVVPAKPAKAKIEADEEGANVIALGEDVFVTAVTRPPAVYRGNPFQVEVGILYSKDLPHDELARVFRFANRVPLLYQASACSMTKAVVSAPWRSYEVQQSKGAPPTGPLVLLVHIASVWVPYTSESKEAIAHYPEVIKEMRLAVMEAGRRLQRFLRRRKRDAEELKKRDYITKYLDPIGEALRDILGLSKAQTDETLESLKIVLERSRGPSTDAERKAAKKQSA
jgi:DNA topoisomerase-6 subunit B